MQKLANPNSKGMECHLSNGEGASAGAQHGEVPTRYRPHLEA